eukprot:138861-Prorocentrum_minimum.AAC.2
MMRLLLLACGLLQNNRSGAEKAVRLWDPRLKESTTAAAVLVSHNSWVEEYLSRLWNNLQTGELCALGAGESASSVDCQPRQPGW